MRGEDILCHREDRNYAGSPPHARGRRHADASDLTRPGITPACAGKTTSFERSRGRHTDHPRMRGEDSHPAQHPRCPDGSPPHARGRRSRSARRRRPSRITPACAGKTLYPAHGPRNRTGSPPHARGRRPYPQTSISGSRITPACAGKTIGSRLPDIPAVGSPPHARGRLNAVDRSPRVIGITPACAGKTHGQRLGVVGEPDHPRMRGEDLDNSILPLLKKGSPPHARGRPSAIRSLAPAWRITPACAGKTRRRPVRSRPHRDHPRMRGEDYRLEVDLLRFGGSPPHARGRLEGTPRKS